MNEALQIITPVLSGLLIAILAWVGRRLIGSVDQLRADFGAHAKDVERRLGKLDTRIAVHVSDGHGPLQTTSAQG